MRRALPRRARIRRAVLAHVLCAVCAVLVLPVSAAAQDQRAFLTLSLNGVEHGDALVVMRDTDALVAVSTLQQAGLRDFSGRRETLDGQPFVSLASLGPRVEFRIDESALRLILTADTSLLGVVVRDLDAGAPADMEYRSAPSAFVNYAASAGTGADYELFGEAGISARGGLFYTTATRSATSTIRGLSNLTIDRRTRLQRWVIGDSFASAGPLGGDALIGGVTVGRDFSLAPYFVRYPTMSVSTPVALPSVLEVHVNGRLIRQEQVEPGRIDVRNLPLSSGQNDTRLVVRDPFGGTREITSGFYVTNSVLARGVHDYQYTVGWRRQSLGLASFDYQDPVAVVRHRVGVSDTLTGGLRVEGSRGLISAGPSLNLRLPLGEVEFAAAASRTGQQRQWSSAAQLSYMYVSRYASVGGQLAQTGKHYANISLRADQERPARTASLFGSVPLGRATASFQHNESFGSDAVSESRSSILASARILSMAELVGSVARSRGPAGRGFEASLGVTMTFGPKTVASITALRTSEGTSTAFDVQRPLPVGTGFGYQFRGEDGTRRLASAVAQYQGSFGRYEVRHDGIGSTPTTTFNVSGGLVAIGGGLYPTRAVRGSYALVQVPGVEGVRTLASNQEVGRTGRRGSLLVPDLLPYYGNLLAITDSDVSLDYEISKVRMTIAPPYRGGAIARFPVRRIQRSEGRVIVVAAGGEQAAAYGTLTIAVEGETIVSPLGAAGEFYFENVPAGKHEAVVTHAQGTCTLTLEIPVVDSLLVSLGVVRCAVR
jgi:outer membrane usher protein